MRSIGVLRAMCKKKHTARAFPAVPKGLSFLVFLLLVSAVPGASLTAWAREDKSITTRGNESVISRDSATGDRVMQTPDPKPQQEYEGPQTIIVTPEVYTGGLEGGQRPSRPDRPRQKQ